MQTTRKRSTDRNNPVEAPTLRVVFEGDSGPVEPRLLALGAGETIVGRTSGIDAGITLNDTAVSRRHAAITRARSGRVSLRDLNSSNGTSVNGANVTEAVSLRDGDLIRLGDSFLVYRVEPAAALDAEIIGLTGVAPTMRLARSWISRLATRDDTVLILGESGTGKGVAARAIHELSGRSGPFVMVNCSAIPHELAESQLFGHEAGAFTGASRANKGLFRQAEGGTLFFDEVGDLPQVVQPKLLTALDHHRVTPLGSSRELAVDVRVIAATNRDVTDEQQFRGDLHARLGRLTVRMPPLRERREDVLTLFCAGLERPEPDLDPDVVEEILLTDWTYNVRELQSTAIAAQLHSELTGRIDRRALEQAMPRGPTRRVDRSQRSHGGRGDEPTDGGQSGGGRAQGSPPDRDELIALLRECEGNLAELARKTGRHRKSVQRWLDKHEIDPDEFRS